MGEKAMESSEPQLYFIPSASGYTAQIDVTTDQSSSLKVYNLRGQLVINRQLILLQGTNSFEIPSLGSGIFVVKLKGESFSLTEKLHF